MEWANINTEKRRLDLARLDLDAAKSKVRGARTPEAMQQNEQKVISWAVMTSSGVVMTSRGVVMTSFASAVEKPLFICIF